VPERVFKAVIATGQVANRIQALYFYIFLALILSTISCNDKRLHGKNPNDAARRTIQSPCIFGPERL